MEFYEDTSTKEVGGGGGDKASIENVHVQKHWLYAF